MKHLFLFLFIFSIVFGSTVYSQRILLSQGFENGPYTADSIPLKWAKIKVNGPGVCTTPAADWRIRDSNTAFCGTNTLTDFTAKAFGNTRKSLSIPWTATTGTLTNDWIFTDSLRIATGDSLIFWCQLGTWSGGTGTHYPDSLQIWITTSQTPSVTGYLGAVRSLPQGSNFWQNIKYDLSAYNGQRVYVAFRYFMNVSVNGIMVNVDSVMVRNLSGPPVSINNNNNGLPTSFDLKQNYPNPFNPSTSISFDLPKAEFVNITIYNSVGQEVAVLVNESKSAGSHELNFDASHLPSGVYLYRLKAGDYVKTMKMSLIK
jgi:hypothetical protein